MINFDSQNKKVENILHENPSISEMIMLNLLCILLCLSDIYKKDN